MDAVLQFICSYSLEKQLLISSYLALQKSCFCLSRHVWKCVPFADLGDFFLKGDFFPKG